MRNILTSARMTAMLAAVSVFGTASVFSATVDTVSSSLLALVGRNYGPDVPLSAGFTQTIYWSVREKEERKKGKIWLAPGDRFRVEAGGEVFVSDGETFRHFSPQTGQLVVRRLSDVDRSSLPSQIFERYIASLPFRRVGGKRGVAAFEWKGGPAETPYREIRVEVREKDRRITRCVLTDRNGNTFTYGFSATVSGKRIADERFKLDAPENARIVDMRE
jgi:outer membrane lipoprotein-sorting protein